MTSFDKSNDAKQILPAPKGRNPLATASLVVSAIALAVCVLSIGWVYLLEAQKNPDKNYQSGDATMVVDKAENVLTFFGQVILFLVGGAVGGTLSLVGFILGCIGLGHESGERRNAIIGMVLSGCSFVIMALFLLVT